MNNDKLFQTEIQKKAFPFESISIYYCFVVKNTILREIKFCWGRIMRIAAAALHLAK